MRIGVFGNCQATSLANCLSALAPGLEIHRFSLPRALRADAGEIGRQMAAFSACDHVFLQPALTHPVEEMSAEAFDARCRSVIPFPNFVYRAFHPDCHYLTAKGGGALAGAIGQYHSSIVAGAFLARLSVDRTARLFNRLVYRLMGFLDMDPHAEPLALDARRYGYDLADFLSGRRGCFMHTINHPSTRIVMEVARQGLSRIGVTATGGAAHPDDPLSGHTIWPAYPSLGEGDDDRSIVFRNRSKGLELGLDEFVARSFDLYAAAPARFGSAQSDRMVALIGEHVLP